MNYEPPHPCNSNLELLTVILVAVQIRTNSESREWLGPNLDSAEGTQKVGACGPASWPSVFINMLCIIHHKSYSNTTTQICPVQTLVSSCFLYPRYTLCFRRLWSRLSSWRRSPTCVTAEQAVDTGRAAATRCALYT
jgi:hypothetical protein